MSEKKAHPVKAKEQENPEMSQKSPTKSATDPEIQRKLILVLALILSAGLSGCSTRAPKPMTTGDWSETVHGLRGRLPVTEEAEKFNGTHVVLVYLELRNVENVAGPMEIYYAPDDTFQYLLDESKHPEPFGLAPGDVMSPFPNFQASSSWAKRAN